MSLIEETLPTSKELDIPHQYRLTDLKMLDMANKIIYDKEYVK